MGTFWNNLKIRVNRVGIKVFDPTQPNSGWVSVGLLFSFLINLTCFHLYTTHF